MCPPFGPSFAHDVARGLPCAVTLACTDTHLGYTLAHTIGRTLRPYYTSDVIGVEVGGAVKMSRYRLRHFTANPSVTVRGRLFSPAALPKYPPWGRPRRHSETLWAVWDGGSGLTATSMQSRNFSRCGLGTGPISGIHPLSTHRRDRRNCHGSHKRLAHTIR